MKPRFGSGLLCSTLTALLGLGSACTQVEGDYDDEVGLEEAESGGQIIEGGLLFNIATFGGNGRRCASCHPLLFGQSGTLNPAQVQLRFFLNP